MEKVFEADASLFVRFMHYLCAVGGWSEKIRLIKVFQVPNYIIPFKSSKEHVGWLL
jgi:hypothetical protein